MHRHCVPLEFGPHKVTSCLSPGTLWQCWPGLSSCLLPESVNAVSLLSSFLFGSSVSPHTVGSTCHTMEPFEFQVHCDLSKGCQETGRMVGSLLFVVCVGLQGRGGVSSAVFAHPSSPAELQDCLCLTEVIRAGEAPPSASP